MPRVHGCAGAVDFEYPFKTLRPSHGLVMLFQCFLFIALLCTAFATLGWRHLLRGEEGGWGWAEFRCKQ